MGTFKNGIGAKRDKTKGMFKWFAPFLSADTNT